MSTRNSRKKTRINCVGSIDDRGSQSNNDFDSISPESCHYITREQAYSENEIEPAQKSQNFQFISLARQFSFLDGDRSEMYLCLHSSRSEFMPV